MHKARLIVAGTVTVLLVAAVAMRLLVLPPQGAALKAMQRGDFSAALAELGRVESPPADVLATRLAILLGLLGADSSLQQEFDLLTSTVYDGESQTDGVLADQRAAVFARFAKNQELLQELARQFTLAFKPGESIHSPWSASTLRISVSEKSLTNALNALSSGDLSFRHFTTLIEAAEQAGVISVLQILLDQPVGDTRVRLSGEYNLPALLYYVGVRVRDQSLATWYMKQVIALSDPENEYRAGAKSYLERNGNG